MSNNKKIILTEKLVDSTFRSGLRLNTDDANNVKLIDLIILIYILILLNKRILIGTQS